MRQIAYSTSERLKADEKREDLNSKNGMIIGSDT